MDTAISRRSALRVTALGGLTGTLGISAVVATSPMAHANDVQEAEVVDWVNGGPLPKGSNLPTDREINQLINEGKIIEAFNDDGDPEFRVDNSTQEDLRVLSDEINQQQKVDVSVWRCGLAIGSFIALTAFPSARVAAVA